MMDITSECSQPLHGKRVLVTALDLEQRKHRGIAVYSKALIRHLADGSRGLAAHTISPDHIRPALPPS